MGEEYLLILDMYRALLNTKISSRTSFFWVVHFQPLIGQVGDAPVCAHQTAQNVKLGDAPSFFLLGFSTLGLDRFHC